VPIEMNKKADSTRQQAGQTHSQTSRESAGGRAWKEYRFSDFVQIAPKVTLNHAVSHSFVEMADLQDGNKFCSASVVKQFTGSGTKFQDFDTLFARITPCLENGKICQVRNLSEGKGFGSTEFHVLRGKEGLSDTGFVFYLSRFSDVRDFAEANLHGTSGRQRVPREAFDTLFLNLPPLPEQRSIATVLSSLDDKIDLLHRQNKTLEGMASTLWRKMFVEEARIGWKTTTVGEVATINGKSIDKDYPFEEIDYLDTGSITEGRISEYQHLQLKDAPSRARRFVQKNDIVVSMVRPIQKHYGILKKVAPNTIASTGFVVISCHKIDPHFLYVLLTQKEMTEFLDIIAEASTTTYPSLAPSDIEKIDFQMPPAELLQQFSEYAGHVWDKIEGNNSQIRTLSKTRDTILPKLMSGEIRVKL